METIERTLREHPFLRGLDEDQFAFMVGCARSLRYDPGAFLFREGEEAKSLFLLNTGHVALEAHAPDRGVTRLESLDPGDLVGLSWLTSPYKWQLDAHVLETTTVLAFDATCLRKKMDAEPRFGYALTSRILREVVHRLDRVRLQRLDLYRAER